jgi:hypothetical protein
VVVLGGCKFLGCFVCKLVFVDGFWFYGDGLADGVFSWLDCVKYFCCEGRLHWVGGSAVVRSNGCHEWWVDGRPDFDGFDFSVFDGLGGDEVSGLIEFFGFDY